MAEVESAIPPLLPTDSRVTVGRFSYGNPRFMLWTQADVVRIGAFCSIADNVTIFGGGEHNTDWVTTFPLRLAFGDPLGGKDGLPSTKGPTRIGSDVWIGFGATILSGVVVGDGAVVGAQAVVARDIPPYSIAVGNPASVIGCRFGEKEIEVLLEIAWWNWPVEKIRAFVPLLCSSDVEAFIRNAASSLNAHQVRSS